MARTPWKTARGERLPRRRAPRRRDTGTRPDLDRRASCRPDDLFFPVLALLLAGCSALVPFLRASMSSESMGPTIRSGTEIVVRKTGDYRPGRGDVVLFKAPTYWRPSPPEAVYVSRVIGVPGAVVECCDATGRLLVDDAALEESYLAASPAAREKFRVRVPPGRLWLMSDNRDVALDSRAHQGDGGDGTIDVSDVIGVVDLP
ncbi:signal peptidase I [Nonomuraea maritima]|nr:signal peptidase I [Nonomuraea maritima]